MAYKEPKVGIMIDIETLSLRTTAVCWEVAMISFPLDDPDTHVREFTTILPIQPQLDMVPARTIDAGTLGYWFKKSEDARERFQACVEGEFEEYVSWLNRIVREFKAMTEGLKDDEYVTICKGLNFDIPVLESMFKAVGITPPWHYRTLHCLRTTMRDAGLDQFSIPFPAEGIQHVALWDCRHQINLWVASQKLLGSGKL